MTRLLSVYLYYTDKIYFVNLLALTFFCEWLLFWKNFKKPLDNRLKMVNFCFFKYFWVKSAVFSSFFGNLQNAQTYLWTHKTHSFFNFFVQTRCFSTLSTLLGVIWKMVKLCLINKINWQLKNKTWHSLNRCYNKSQRRWMRGIYL